MTSQQEYIQMSNSLFVNTYARLPVVMVEGEGSRLIDAEGKKYLDFLSGIAVCSLGHCHPEVTRAIIDQAQKLVHVSNLFHTIPQIDLAEKLIANSFADRVFFANSGAEANEAAIKLARKHGGADRYEILSFQGSFHGRTLATVAATGQEKFHQGFEPLPEGFKIVPFADIQAVEKAISPNTCAILCEPIQGESGVRPFGAQFLQELRALCDRHQLLLIFDEVQVGLGRTGKLFAYEHFNIAPDIITLAKALANGLPLGAMLTRQSIAESFAPGSHASTFGGNPVSCAAANVVISTLLKDDFLEHVQKMGDMLHNGLKRLAEKHPDLASGARGTGLIQGLILTPKGIELGTDMVREMFGRGFIINFAGNAVLRFLPPLIISHEEISLMLEALDAVLASHHTKSL